MHVQVGLVRIIAGGGSCQMVVSDQSIVGNNHFLLKLGSLTHERAGNLTREYSVYPCHTIRGFRPLDPSVDFALLALRPRDT